MQIQSLKVFSDQSNHFNDFSIILGGGIGRGKVGWGGACGVQGGKEWGTIIDIEYIDPASYQKS